MIKYTKNERKPSLVVQDGKVSPNPKYDDFFENRRELLFLNPRV